MSRNIYEVARFAVASIADYPRVARELSDERQFRAVSYAPARSAILAYHRSAGDTGVLDEAIATQTALEDGAATDRDAVQPRNNAEVLRVYKESFAAPFRPLRDVCPSGSATYTWPVDGVVLSGKPHLAVAGRIATKYLYLVTAKDLADESKRWLVTLLAEIVIANVPGARHRDVEGLDLRSGSVIKGAPLSARRRTRLRDLCDVLKRLGLA
jgi:hypothetical protein